MTTFDAASSPDAPSPDRPLVVLAVLVSHDAMPWLPRTLGALEGLDRAPDLLVAVDTGSVDATASLLAASPVVDQVVAAARTTGFPSAVAAAVEAGRAALRASGRTADVLWLLHDDCAPEPAALAALERAALDSPSIGVLGPKVLGWDDPRRLLEVGVTISGSGRREVGLEHREQDQGQHDGQHDVLAVGSAGLLVRAALWDSLGGLDTRLQFFRDDVDLGWRANLAGERVAVVTDAVVHHAEAMSRGRRALAIEGGRVHRVDRISAMTVVLANAGALTWPLRWLRLLVGSLVRALGLLVAKAPGRAADEVAALGHVVLRLDRVLAARRARRGHRAVSGRTLRPLFPRPGSQVRQTLEVFGGLLAARAGAEHAPSGILESGPSEEDTDSMGASSGGVLRATLRRPGVLATLGLLLVALVSWRALFSGGSLFGGALLPAPVGASDLWDTYLGGWHPVVTGSSVPTAPSMAVLSGLAALVLGRAELAVGLLLVLAVPVCGVLAYRTVAGLGLSGPLRLWVAVAYALNPALLAGIAQGRLGTVVVALVLPLLALTVVRTVGSVERPGTFAAAATAGLLLSVMTAFAPVVWVIALPLTALAVWRLAVGRRARVRLVVAWATPAVVLLPWSAYLLAHPALFLLESGEPLAAPGSPTWQVLLLVPGGPGSAPWVLGLGVVVAGLASVLRVTVPLVRAALVVAGVALVAALVLASVTVTPPSSAVPVAPWPGPALVVASAGLMLAAVVAARQARRRISGAQFGWRQPAVVVLAVLALLAPLSWGAWWVVRGAADPLQRGDAAVLPAFVAAAADQPEQVRTLVLQMSNERLEYSLLRDRGPQLGDAETAPPASDLRGLDATVSDVASGRGGSAVTDLTRYAVRYILLAAPVDAQLESTLDSVPGLVRVANPGDAGLWRVELPAGRLQLLTPVGGGRAADTVTVLPSGALTATPTLASGPADRTLWLAENTDPGWQASLTDEAGGASDALPAAVGDGWAQTFEPPTAGGGVLVDFDEGPRTRWLLAQAVAVVVMVVIAVPARRRDESLDDEELA